MNDFHATLTSLVSHLEFFQDYKLIFLVFVLSVFLTNQNQEFSRGVVLPWGSYQHPLPGELVHPGEWRSL